MAKTEIQFFPERLTVVTERLYANYEQKGYPYNRPDAVLPQDFVPPRLVRGGREEALYFFYLCIYMRMQQSNVAARKMAEIYDMELWEYSHGGNIFEPADAARMDPVQVGEFMRANGLGQFYKTNPGYWVQNSAMLMQEWDGDPRNMFANIRTYEDALKHVRKFRGFDKKMTSMILYFMMDVGLMEPFIFPIPVDFHVQRIAAETDSVTWPYGVQPGITNDRLGDLLRPFFQDYAEEHGVSPLRLADVLWLHGSLMCEDNPGNRTHAGEYNARSTHIQPHHVTWKRAEVASFMRSCAQCPVRKLCTTNVPSEYNSTLGKIVRDSPREEPPSDWYGAFESTFEPNVATTPSAPKATKVQPPPSDHPTLF